MFAATVLVSFLHLTVAYHHMYEQNNPDLPNNPLEYHNIETRTSEIFQRLNHYEIVDTVSHNQFHAIDDNFKAFYPTSGLLQFNAFNRHYKLFFNKNRKLLHPEFHTTQRVFNEMTQEYELVKNYDPHRNNDKKNCYYTATVTTDSGNKTRAVFSVCKGRGVRGWIHAFGETIVIRPLRLLTNIDYKQDHRIDHQHIVYRYHDLDRSGYPHTRGEICGHSHPGTLEMIQKDLRKYENNSEVVQHITNTLLKPIQYAQQFEEMHRGEHDHDHDHDHENDNIIAQPFSKQSQGLVLNMRRNLLKSRNKKRRLASTTTRYVELTAVVDPAYIGQYNNVSSEIEDAVIETVSYLQAYYYDQAWSSDVGVVQIVLSQLYYVHNWNLETCNSYSTCLPDISQNSCSESERSTGSKEDCETSYSDYLGKFNKFRQSIEYYDNAQLFSYWNFFESVIGYASLPGMCISSSSGGIEQCTYDDEYNANIIAHEMGHNFNMQHDSSGNACDASDYIMASVGSPYGYRPDSFSSCSDVYMGLYFDSYSSTATCTANEPYATEYAVCGNGFTEQGESCDCGSDDCSSTDGCCDGSKCALYLDAECSDDDLCCSECSIKSEGTICRTLEETNDCDISEEVCDGVSSECPTDTFNVEGVECTPYATSSSSIRGFCYDGNCVSISEQCEVYGDSISTSLSQCDNSGFSPLWATDSCSDSLHCAYSTDTTECVTVPQEDYDDGTPCTDSCSAAACVCVGDTCEDATTVYTYVWTTEAWSTCTISCKEDKDDADGTQSRSVYCTLQNGTRVNSTNCDTGDEPIGSRTCNDYICDFCAELMGGEDNQCVPGGECIEVGSSGYCDCHAGWGGELCDIPPNLGFMSVVSETYKNLSGATFTDRVDPCNNGTDFYDSASNTYTRYYYLPDDNNSISNVSIGSTLGIRWNSTGELEYLAVGLQRVDENGDVYSDDWPFYVGSSLATDKQSCEEKNSSDYDPCLTSLSCNDFTFAMPKTLVPGLYVILIRFNNYFNVRSNILRVSCADVICDSVGHGSCYAAGTGCNCDDYWWGDSCEESYCADWSFSICYKAANETSCSLSQTSFDTNRCFADENECNSSVTVQDTACSKCGPHWNGDYCELPRDACSETSSNACTNNGLATCSWHAASSQCVYSACDAYSDDQPGCEAAQISLSDKSWSDYCYYDSATAVCDRVTCDESELPSCENGAVRRPLLDAYSDNPTSICYGWYCDCTTVDVDDAYWAVSTTNVLSDSVSSDFSWKTTLTSQYLTNQGLFTCNNCELDCGQNSVVDDTCTACDECDEDTYQGTECNQLFWIASFRLNLDWSSAFVDHWEEFLEIMVQDLSYFLSVDTDYINIYELKPSGDKSVVYFRIMFDTDDEDETQALGGDLMFFAKDEVDDANSTASRGLLMQYTDSSYSFQWCLPLREECDPDNQVDVLLIFYICMACSFGFEIILVIVYRIVTRRKRRGAYEERVKKVRSAQLKLFEHHSKAQRVGMKDVTKKRAKKITTAKKKKQKAEDKEMARRATIEKQRARASSKQSQKSKDDFEEVRDSRASSDQGRIRGSSAVNRQAAGSVYSNATDPATLPPGWKIFYNADGIPYYFNDDTSETTWRHPAEQPTVVVVQQW